MKITEIRIDGTKSLGNYENRKFGFTAVIEEGETTREAIESENGTGDPKKLATLRAWLDKYETTKAEIEAMQ